MKKTYAVLVLAAGTTLLLATGCGKQDDAKPMTTPESPVKPAATAATETKTVADNPPPVAATPNPAPAATPAPVVTNTPPPAVSDAASATNSQVQTILDKAKSLITDQKYQDALASLQQLSGVKLTSDQQKLVDTFKTQIQAALTKQAAGDAAGALGNALGIKK